MMDPSPQANVLLPCSKERGEVGRVAKLLDGIAGPLQIAGGKTLKYTAYRMFGEVFGATK